MEKRPQEPSRNPLNGSYPVIKGIHRKIINYDSRILLPEREQDWSHVHKGQMFAVFAIAIVFAVLIICSVFC